MDHESRRAQLTNPDSQHEGQFSAAKWETSCAEQFVAWRKTSGLLIEQMSTFGQAIATTVYDDPRQLAPEIATQFKPVLASCDYLSFDAMAEALAYAGLHLLDRYGRVNQVLEHLLRIGRLPLRKRGVLGLEVGAGPAPALYAVRDFYSALRRFPGRGTIEVGRLEAFDTLDRGDAWDPFLHRLSEALIQIPGREFNDGALAFRRTLQDFKGLDVAGRHHRAVAKSAQRIADEFDNAGESVSDTTARQMAYEQGVAEPSAYDLVFLCNFLTQLEMLEDFEVEIHRLAHNLTPGGVLAVLGGTGGRYPELYSHVRQIASRARLRDVSPHDPFLANRDPDCLSLIAKHVRGNVEWVLASLTAENRQIIARGLPTDLVDQTVQFKLPKFQVLLFVRQGSPRRGKPRRRVS